MKFVLNFDMLRNRLRALLVQQRVYTESKMTTFYDKVTIWAVEYESIDGGSDIEEHDDNPSCVLVIEAPVKMP